MNIGQVVMQLRQLSGIPYVEATQDFEAINEDNTPLRGAADAFVAPLAIEAGENESDTGYYQMVTDVIGVYVRFNTAKYKTVGDTGVSPIEDMAARLRQSIVNWCPAADIDVAYKAIYEGHAERYRGANAAVLTWLFMFKLDKFITDDDTWRPDGPVLQEIDIYDSSIPTDTPPTVGQMLYDEDGDPINPVDFRPEA